MTEICREPANLNEPPAGQYRGALRAITRLFHDDKLLIFLGAGCGIDLERPSLPTATALAKEMIAECGLDWHDDITLATAAFYYEFFENRTVLNSFLRQRLSEGVAPPSKTMRHLMDVLKVLQDWSKTLVVTTNYDRQFEAAYRTAFTREPAVVIYNGGTDANDETIPLHVGLTRRNPRFWGPSAPTTLYKMHGCISDTGTRNLVVTEEDYVNFLANAFSHREYKCLLPHVVGKLAESSILFIGYSLSDWNFRVIFKATAEREGPSRSYAVQRFTPPVDRPSFDVTRWNAAVRFWNRKDVEILNVDAAVFLSDLLTTIREVPREVPRVGAAVPGQ